MSVCFKKQQISVKILKISVCLLLLGCALSAEAEPFKETTSNAMDGIFLQNAFPTCPNFIGQQEFIGLQEPLASGEETQKSILGWNREHEALWDQQDQSWEEWKQGHEKWKQEHEKWKQKYKQGDDLIFNPTDGGFLQNSFSTFLDFTKAIPIEVSLAGVALCIAGLLINWQTNWNAEERPRMYEILENGVIRSVTEEEYQRMQQRVAEEH